MELLEALYRIAELNGSGDVPDYVLVKACNNYKINCSYFIESEDYDIKISKSISDYLNNNEPEDEVCKAVLPGTTKVVDGVVYIYTATPGAKTQYDWRVYSNPNSALNTAKQTSKKAVISQRYVNDLFPLELASFVNIKKLGGSTGAELVKDSGGAQYVMKKGSNTSSAHVESEYIANQLYEILGVRTPDYELYDDKGEKVLVSKFIHNATVVSASDYNELSKNFIIDAFLANRDVYQNDNCLKDASGRIYRVDNGSCLSFRAGGSTKKFDEDVANDLKGMIQYNGHVIANLSDQDIIDQITDLQTKKDFTVDFLAASGQQSLSDIISKRFDKLEDIKKEYEKKIQKKVAKSALKNAPRNLLPDADMYKEFDDVELDSIFKSVSGSWYDKVMNKTYRGWELVENICKLRGFDARPEVVNENTYWQEVKKNPENQLFRGLTKGNKPSEEYADDFKYDDECFYGSVGIYGSGIYFHANDNSSGKQHDKTDYKNSRAYGHALQYANYQGTVIDALLSPKAKIAKYKDLIKQLEAEVVFDDSQAKAIQSKINLLKIDLKEFEDEFHNVTYNTENNVRNAMHWDQNSYIMHAIEIDAVNWGAIDEHGNPTYPDFNSFFHGKIKGWVEANGGTVTEKAPNSNAFILKLPNSKQTFLLSEYTYMNNAIKQKNAFTKAYNYPVERFRDWFVTNHFAIINKKVEEEVSNLGDKITDLKSEIMRVKSELSDQGDELNKVKNKNVNPDKDIISCCVHAVKTGREEALGIYAAVKGYDAIKVPNGNGIGNSFIVVLNRSKVIVKE